MSLPLPTSDGCQSLVEIQPAILTPPSNIFPGFALPEAALHSIPLPPEFDELVRAATEENRIKTVLPKFFNALFRRQGVVNKHALHALESVGRSLAQLAREIENRDRVLEMLTAHLNSYGEHAQKSHLGLVHYAQQLTKQVEEVAGNLQTQMERDAASARTRTSILTATSRATELRLKDLHDRFTALHRQADELSRAAGQHDIKLQGHADRLTEWEQRVSVESATLHQQVAMLQDALAASELRSAELRQSLETAKATEVQARLESQAALTALSERLDASLAKQRDFIEQNHSAHLAEIRELMERAKASSHAADAQLRTESQATLTALAQRLEASLLQQRAAFEQDQASRLVETRQQIDTVTARCAALEAELATFKSESESGEAKARGESVISAVRATSLGHKDLSSQIESLRADLLVLAESCTNLGKKQEATEASLDAATLASKHLLPSLQAHLAELAKTAARPQRRALTAKALETVHEAQAAQSDAFYVALEARFRGPRALIRERQSRYLPIVAEARNRVETFPPSPRVVKNDHPLNSLYAGNGVLDLGCGRGEWLDLLEENDVPAVGVDHNQFFLQTCRQYNRKAIDSDLMEFLRQAPDDSVAVVTSFHVIEHLPVPVFQEMVRHVFRILRRGGTAIMETPNPANILTGGLNFLLDPTHLRPVHPEFAKFVMETGGFSSVRLDFMSPYDPTYKVGDPKDPLAQRFNEYFYGPQDFAVIGIKP